MISDVKHLYLCRPDLSIITELNGVNRDSVSYSQHTKDFDTLDFVVDEYIESPGDSDGLIEGYRKSNGYDYLDKSMYILLEDVGYFIMEYPVIENDGLHETKQVSAYSLEKELYNRDWLNFKVNTGEEDSLESIATDNLNELGIPKNFVTFYCPSNPELSLLDLLLTKLPGWSLGEIDPLLVNKKIGQYKEPNINIYALLTSVIGPKVPCIFTFDIMHRKINAYSQESLELDSNIFIGFRNLAQNVTIQVEEDSIITRLRCYGDNELSFEAINYGSTQIVNLSYFMREPYMSDELVAKVEAWQAYQDENRETFKELGRASADLNEKMDEVKYRVPSDGVMQDWSDLNEEALLESQKYYEALLTSLQVSVDPNPQYDAEEKYIPWDDGEGNVDHERYLALLYDLANGYGGYYTYKEIQEYILPNIQIALDNLNIPEDDQESYVETWKTNWDLYGIEELEGKKKDYTNRLEALVVYSKDWEELTPEEKAAQVNEDYYNIQHAEYTKIAGYLDEDSPTSLPAKLAELQAEYDDLKDQLDLNEENRIAMINPSRMYYTNDDGEIVYNFEFTAADMAIVEPLLIDSDYVNSNIISTSVDTSVSRFDRQQELFDDSVDKLSELCQPQYKFTTNLDNLYRLPEFKDFAEDLKLLTYIRLGIRDDYSVKLRVVGITWNPCEITPDLELEFSNMISSRSGRTDYVDILQTENERASKNSVALGTGNSDTDKEYLTNLLNLMITNRLFTNAVSNISGMSSGGSSDSAGYAGTAGYAANAGTAGTAGYATSAGTASSALVATNAINIDPTGNISSIISDYIKTNKIDVGYITGDAADFRRLFADYIDAESIVTNVLKADQATLNQLTTKVVTADSISTGILNATDAQITNIKSKVVTADDIATKLLSATDANITNLSSKLVTSETVTTATLNATDAQIQNIRSRVVTADDITTRLLSAENARLGELSAGIIEAGEATIRDLAANNVTSEYIFTNILEANQARVGELISDVAASASSQIFNLTSSNATIDSVLARSIVAGNVTASDIQVGDITLSDDLKIKSENGWLTADGDTLLIGRTNQDGTLQSGVQIGYNAQDEPSVIVKNENGATVMTAEGITSAAVADSLIVNRMIQDGTVTPGKLSFNVETDEDGNIITSIDNIYLGDGGQFGVDYTTFKQSTESEINNLNSDIASNASSISQVSSTVDEFANQIANKVSQSDFNSSIQGIENDIDKSTGINKWMVEIYSKDSLPEANRALYDFMAFTGTNINPAFSATYLDENISKSFLTSQSYIGYALTFVNVETQFTWTHGFSASGNGRLYVNGSQVTGTTITLKVGWNVIEVIWNIGTAKPNGFTFSNKLGTNSNVLLMNCYHRTITGREASEVTRTSELTIDLNGITSRVSSAETNINTNAGNITTLNQSVSTVSQTADKINWLVKSGSSQSSVTLTDAAVTAVTNQFVIKDPEGSATIISGGKIQANSITANMLAANAIKSQNYRTYNSQGQQVTDGVPYNSPYSSMGTLLDLSTGSIYTPNFGVDNGGGKAYINGEIIATSGKIGGESGTYWEIAPVEEDSVEHAAIISNGNAFINTGQWTIKADRLNSQSVNANKELVYPSYNNRYYDFGVHIPMLNSAASGYINGVSDDFLYIRYHDNNVPSIESDWNYVFRVDKNGMIYINGLSLDQKYASIDGVSGAYLPRTGGTITENLTVEGDLTVEGSIMGNASSATKVNNSITINGKSFDGSSPVDAGTIGVAYGGTGNTSWTAAGIIYASTANTLGQLSTGTSGQILSSGGNTAPTWINQSAITAGSATKDSAGHTISSYYAPLSGATFTGAVTFNGAVTTSSTFEAADAEIGDLTVTGTATFADGLEGDLTGNATTADKVNNDLVISLNGGTTEGTNKFTYNGSAAKNVNITKSSIGLGNVENTALSTWAGSAKLTTTKVGTLAAAAVKGVDTSISDESTSVNLPTSAAVATFVEGKGYVTSSGVTSVQIQATSPVVSSVNTAQSSTLNTTISLANAYGDTKNPYGTKTKNYVLAGPTTGSAAAPTFRALVADDIPTLTPAKAGLGNVTNNKQVKGLSSGTTSGHLVSWGSDGYTVADSGIAVSSVNKTVKSLASDSDGKIVLTYLDGTTSDPIEVKIIGSSGSSVSYADALNVNETAVGAAEQPVFINSQGKPQTANKIPKLNNGTTGGTFYAPTAAGTSEQYLKSNGSGAPTWATFSKSTVGLGNVDNTSDANKPISTATQTALDDKAPKNRGVYLVKGTQTATTAAWTGELELDELYDGLTIAYYLPTTSAANATLTLTLSNGNQTAAIPVYYTASTRAGTHYGAGSTIILTYWSAGSISINGTPTEQDRWTRGDYSVSNTNTIGEYAGSCTAGDFGMARYSLILRVGDDEWESLVATSSTAETKTMNTHGFYMDTPILYQSGGTIAPGANSALTATWITGQALDTRYSFNCTNSWSSAGKSLYLVGTISDGKFYLKPDQWWADELPTTADGYYYWFVGHMYDKYRYALHAVHPIYYYRAGDGIVQYTLLTKKDLGLGNVDNTADANKNVLTATKFSSARTIQLTGDATGSASSDGTNGWSITTSVNHADAADSATKATKDGSGNTITSYYVTLSTAQTVSGAKTFSGATAITNTTASTSKSTGALKVSGGVGVAGQMSADKVMVGDGVVLQFNTSTNSLDFVFN